jgi:hypothetical protein
LGVLSENFIGVADFFGFSLSASLDLTAKKMMLDGES